MPEALGSDILLLVNIGTDVSPNYQVVGSQRNVTFNETVTPIDLSSKDKREEKLDPRGRWACTVSLDTLYVPGQTEYAALQNAERSGQTIKIRRRELGSDVEEADAVVTGLSGAFPDVDAATVSAELRVNGPWSAI